VLGTPVVTDTYIRDFVSQNCIKIMRDVEKFEPLTVGFTHFQVVQKTMNTRTQYMSVIITLLGTVKNCHPSSNSVSLRITTPGTILNGTTPSCRHIDRKRYSQERYSRFCPSKGQG
jgi:hypothetical protein